MGKILYGKQEAQNIRAKIRNSIVKENEKGHRRPGLAVIIVGDDSASLYYADLIKKAGKKEGVVVQKKHLEESNTEKVIKLINELNKDKNIDGILIQLPLPKKIDKDKVFSGLAPEKDVDGQTPVNLGLLASRQKGIFPATARAVVKILKCNNIEIKGKDITVVGRSTAVGLPASLLLLKENATVTICHSVSQPLEKYTKNAEILVVAAGKPNLIRKKHVKKGASVVDVGTNDVKGKIVGDVDIDRVIKKASVSPAVGGVGALTMACLLENTYELYRKNLYSNTDK
ncbi:MAG: bifunctional 5,10-methylenetetrahydrofolate dehydrogenase/5,10-methenyltetrahydrofolate cyclohydrolase [Elusimicrobiota bacterium]